MNTTTLRHQADDTTRQTEGLSGKLYRFHGFKVLDSSGQSVGSVDWVWGHDLSGNGEFIGMRLHWLRGTARAIPVAGAHVDMDTRTIRIAVSKEQIARAPRFSITRRLRTDQKLAIVSHLGRHAVTRMGRQMIADRAA